MKASGIILIIASLIIFDVFIWSLIIFERPSPNPEIYFLDVGQGDAELVILPGGAKVLIDGGPDKKVLGELAEILQSSDRYIDLVVMSHPQTDHFTGLIDVLKRYKVGAFIWSGKSGSAQSFSDLEKALGDNDASAVILGRGDAVRYNDHRFEIVSPGRDLLQSAEPNDWGLVMKFQSGGRTTLFTADIDSKMEESLLKNYDLDIDILKVAHHGSRFSSANAFIRAATPKVAVIEVGKNTYGHPTPQTISRLASVGSQIFRTDQDGTIKLILASSTIDVFRKKD